jgi:hypothetical protein
VEISFIGQPFPGVSQIGSVVQAALEEGANTSAWFATAWGKRSGLGRLAPSLERFRAEGGKAEIVLGIDEAGATAEGLLLASELFDSAWIFHDPGPRTFHPKMYAVQSDLKATVVIGSGNLTKGGLFTNYEIATAAGLDLGVPGEASFLADARAYFEQLIGSKSCRPLTAELIEELRSDPRVLLLSEEASNKARAKARTEKRSGSSVFGTKALAGLLGAPPLGPKVPGGAQHEDADDVPPDLVAGKNGPGATTVSSTVDEGQNDGDSTEGGIDGFFKALSKNDVSLKSSPGQIIIPIAYLPFFGALQVQNDKAAAGGPRQSHREFPLAFRRGTEEQLLDGRVVLYEPAADHKRPNSEVRFRFRNREILKTLAKDDVLRFKRAENVIVMEWHPAGWRPEGVPDKTRYGLA